MAGTGQTGITGDPIDLPGVGSAQAKYIKIDVPDFNNALAKTAGGPGSGQGSMRTYLRLGAIESKSGAPVAGGSAPKDKLYNMGKAPNAADLADLVRAVGGNPMLWSTTNQFGTYNIGAINAAETNNTDNWFINASTGLYSGVDINTATASQLSGIQSLTSDNIPLQSGNSVSVTVGLVIPGQLTATMINAGTTGTTGDPYLQELVPSVYDSTGEDLVSLVKGFMDDSRMRSDGGVQTWQGRDVAIQTPFSPGYSVAVGGTAFLDMYPQGLPTPAVNALAAAGAGGKLTIDPDFLAITPAPLMMPTWGDPGPPPTGPDPWGNTPGLPDWSLGGFPASTDLPGDAAKVVAKTPLEPPPFTDWSAGATGPIASPTGLPFVQGWMVPIRLGGPQMSMWGAQATPNTSTGEGPLLGWDPHPAANANSPDWVGAIITIDNQSTLPTFGLDDDGDKLAAGVPLDPRDKWSMTPLPGYGRIFPQLDPLNPTQLLTPEAPSINAVSDWLATDYRALETGQLNLKGGWRDHTDGNRITTTRGDKVEVIRGNYKLIVIGRQDGSKGAGFDMGGGGNDSVTTGAATTDPTTLATITEYKLCDDGQYRSWSTTKKGSGTPKLGGDGVTVTLPTGSVQVAETWGWKSYTYTGVEKAKILSGGAGPAAGGAPWFGRVKYSGTGDPSDPRSYVPVATPYTQYNPQGSGFAAGPAKPIAGSDIFAKGGLNDDTRGMIWPVAETISESHTTKTYAATFVRDTVAITAGPMLTVPFSMDSTTGAGMLVPWPSGQGADPTTIGGYSVGTMPLQLPPNNGAEPSVNAATGSVTYGPAPIPLVLDAFGAFPLGRTSPNLVPNKTGYGAGAGGGLSSDYPPSNGGPAAFPGDPAGRMALEGTGIPIPGQPYQKVNSTTAETHVRTQIARTYADLTFAQSFTGKSYAQSGHPNAWNGLTNALTWVNFARAESHTGDSQTYTYVGTQHTESTVVTHTEAYSYTADQYAESHIGHQKTVSHIGVGAGSPNDPHWEGAGMIVAGGISGAVAGAGFGPIGAAVGAVVGAFVGMADSFPVVQETETHITGDTTAETYTIGATSAITMFLGASSVINLTAGVTSSIKINASIDFSLNVTAVGMSITIGGPVMTIKIVAAAIDLYTAPVKSKLAIQEDNLHAMATTLGVENSNIQGVDNLIAAIHTVL